MIIARLLSSEPWSFERNQVYSVEGADAVIQSNCCSDISSGAPATNPSCDSFGTKDQDGHTPPRHVLLVFDIPIAGEQYVPSAFRSALNKQLGTDVEKLRQFLRLCFANRPLAVKHLGSNSFRPEGLPEIFLRQVTGFHQMLKCLLRTRFPNWIATLLILVNQHRQQFGKFPFFRRKLFTFIKTHQFVRETFAFFIRVDDMGECTPQKLPVSLFV